MAASTNTDAKKLSNWVDGEPAAKIQAPATNNGSLTYWIDGQPYAFVYPSEGSTANFMLFMPL